MRIRINGEPMAEKKGTKTDALKYWEEKLRSACGQKPSLPFGEYRVRIAFVIPRERYQATNTQNPHAKDLDNLVIPVFNALSETVLEPAHGDGAIIELFASKRPSAPAEGACCRVTITGR